MCCGQAWGKGDSCLLIYGPESRGPARPWNTRLRTAELSWWHKQDFHFSQNARVLLEHVLYCFRCAFSGARFCRCLSGSRPSQKGSTVVYANRISFPEHRVSVLFPSLRRQTVNQLVHSVPAWVRSLSRKPTVFLCCVTHSQSWSLCVPHLQFSHAPVQLEGAVMATGSPCWICTYFKFLVSSNKCEWGHSATSGRAAAGGSWRSTD